MGIKYSYTRMGIEMGTRIRHYQVSDGRHSLIVAVAVTVRLVV